MAESPASDDGATFFDRDDGTWVTIDYASGHGSYTDKGERERFKAEILLNHERKLHAIEQEEKLLASARKIRELETQLALHKIEKSVGSSHENVAGSDRVESWVADQNSERSQSLKSSHSHHCHFRQPTAKPGLGYFASEPKFVFPNLALPNLKIKTFYGEPAEWPEWYQSFKSLIEENTMLTESQKVGYLKSFLGDEPKSKVLGLLLDGKNYEKAINELKSRYGNASLIIEAFIQKVRQWPKLQRSNDIPAFCTQVSQLVQVFRTMGYEADLKGKGLLADLTSKLHFSMKESWGSFVVKEGNGDPTVELFHLWLQKKERSLRFGGAFDSFVTDTKSKPSQKAPIVKQTTFVTPSTPQGGDTVKRCPFCDGNHWLTECLQFLKKSPSDRVLWFRSEGRCFLCHRKFHRTRDCQSKRRCPINGCGERHSPLLHDHFHGLNVESLKSATVSRTQHVANKVYLQTLPVRLHSTNGRVIDTFAMLDSGSQATLINESFAKNIGLNGPTALLSIGNIREDEPPRKAKKVSFYLSNPHEFDASPIKVQNAWTFDGPFNLPQQSVPLCNGCPVWPHVSDLNLNQVDASQIKVLIGADTKRAFLQLEVRQGPDNLPMAIKTPLGWTVMGVENAPGVSHDSGTQRVSVNTCHVMNDLHEQVERFWQTDSFGSQQLFEKPFSIDDQKAQERLDTTLCKTPSGNYEVGMLWSKSPVKLQNNRPLAERRLEHQSRKLQKDPVMREKYAGVLNGYIENGYARKMSPEEAKKSSDKTYYLPHHGVVNPKKPEKLRVVFDAAAVYKGESLNENLLTGPDLINSLIGVLMRFRCGSVAISADIESMFHRVFVTPEDSDALRFLWKSDVMASGPPEEYQMIVHIFGAKSSPCCANYCLRRCADDNECGEFSSEAINTVRRSFYVDDLLKASDSVPEAVQVAKEVILLTSTGGFKLTKWASNSQDVLNAICELKTDLGTSTVINLDLDQPAITRTLGLRCDMTSDVFMFDYNETTTLQITKRSILSRASSVFDPLGLIAPFVLRAKLLLQKLWEQQLTWDELITDDDCLRIWSEWCSELSDLHKLKLPRCYWPFGFQPVKFILHTFADASERAFAAVVYLQMTSHTGRVHVALVMSRSRVAPVKRSCLTLPRLELQATVLAVRLHQTVISELDLAISESYFWSDSFIVLHYINNDAKRLKTFVANRVAEIRSATEPDQWRFVPGDLNPADYCTRGLSISELGTSSHWFRGADFLWSGDQSDWPSQSQIGVLDSGDCEVKRTVSKVETNSQNEFNEPIFDPARFSGLSRLRRVTAWCFRFCHNLKNPMARRHGELTVTELDQAVTYWIGIAQCEVFGPEIGDLSSGKFLSKRSKLLNLAPILVDGILRIGGRLRNANIPFSARHQAIIPREHTIAKLLVVDMHQNLNHTTAVEHIIAELRQSYWIVRVRTLVKSVIHACLRCRLKAVQPVVPFMADLPSARVSVGSAPFTITGLDYWGHMYVKRGRAREKRWGCLFTCMVTRAVHLELVASLETDSFILALRRFISRRGKPTDIYSDNGTNFVGANKELKEAVERWNSSAKVHGFLTQKSIQWHFNPPKAPHMGGVWERLVRSTKISLLATLGDAACVHEDTLHTTLCEIESILNSRPLTFVGNSPSDPEPLTPNHFLLNRPFSVCSPIAEDDVCLSSRKRWRQSQYLADQFWKRWRKEYLPTLTVRSKWLSEVRSLKAGDVVLLVDLNSPRGQWPLGIVQEVVPGQDGRVRVVRVRTTSGLFTRPASQVCFLEEAVSDE